MKSIKQILLLLGNNVLNNYSTDKDLYDETITFLMGCGFILEDYRLYVMGTLSDLRQSDGDIGDVIPTIKELVDRLSEDVNG